VTRTEVIGDATLYLGDCLEILPTLGRVDAVVTDPPYGIGQDKGMRGGGYCGKTGKPRTPRQHFGAWDSEAPKVAHLLTAAPRAIIWGGQYFAHELPKGNFWLVWDKQQTMPSYGDGELAWTNLDGNTLRKFTLASNAIIARGETGLHPTQKPAALMRWCLGFVPDARTILDPFMGSGTTGVAALQLGRKFIGIELDPGYFDIACRRIEEAWKQPRLFEEPKRKPQPAPNFFDGAAK
jgi:DNA modification methylase